MLCECLSKKVPSFPSYSGSFVDHFVCDSTKEKCMMNKCDKCPAWLDIVMKDAPLDEVVLGACIHKEKTICIFWRVQSTAATRWSSCPGWLCWKLHLSAPRLNSSSPLGSTKSYTLYCCNLGQRFCQQYNVQFACFSEWWPQPWQEISGCFYEYCG